MTLDRACHRTVTALPWLLNGSLEPAERRAVREHLIGCASCRAELQRARQVVAMVRAAGEPAAAGRPTAATAPIALPGRRRRLEAARRLALAAAVGALVLAGGRLWLATGERPAPGGRTPAPASQAATSPVSAARSTPAPVAVPAAAVAEQEAKAVREPQGPARHGRAAKPARHVTTIRRSAAAAAGVDTPDAAAISSLSFESGSLGAAAAGSSTHAGSTISSSHFESGLEHWTGDSGSGR